MPKNGDIASNDYKEIYFEWTATDLSKQIQDLIFEKQSWVNDRFERKIDNWKDHSFKAGNAAGSRGRFVTATGVYGSHGDYVSSVPGWMAGKAHGLLLPSQVVYTPQMTQDLWCEAHGWHCATEQHKRTGCFEEVIGSYTGRPKRTCNYFAADRTRPSRPGFPIKPRLLVLS